MNSINSYYQSTANDCPDFPSLTSDQTAEVCVIGGGFTGVNTALELAEKGVDVVLVEQHDIGWGGSGRNGGQLICGIGHDPELIRKQLASHEFEQLYALGLEAVQILKQRIDRYQIECDFTWGYCTVAYDQKRLQQLKQAYEMLKTQGYPFDLQLLEGTELEKVVCSERYVGGLWDKGSAHLHPLNLVRGEAHAAIEQGAKVFAHTPVLKIEHSQVTTASGQKKIEILTPKGRITADKVVLACNAYLNGLQPRLQSCFVTTNAFSIATEPLTEAQAAEILPDNTAICDNRPVIDYYRLSGDKRLLFGGATHFVEYLPKDLDGHLRRNLAKVFPQLADIGIDYRWSGRMAIGANLFPQIGTIPEQGNIYYAQAYAGFGVGPSHLIAHLLAEKITGSSERFDMLAQLKHPKIFASQSLNSLWVTAGKCWHQLEARLH